MDGLIKPITTTLPFYRVPTGYVAGVSPQKPFYFQKVRCERDCFFGTITDSEHLPSFIVSFPQSFDISLSTPMDFNLICSDGSSSTPIQMVFRWEVLAFVNTPAELALIIAAVPTVGDKYYYDDGIADVEILTWNGAAFIGGGQIAPADNDLMDVVNDGFVYAWHIDPESTDINNARKGKWSKTLNGFQLCDIGDDTLLIYNGFKIEELPCGLHQIEIDFGDVVLPPLTNRRWLSELVDVREFNILNNDYHKLEIDNGCALGNIPYADIFFNQIYYFDLDVLVGEPKTTTNDSKEEDGLGGEKLIFSNKSKVFTLDTYSIPEYIVDWMHFATQHDSVHLTYPLEFTNVQTLNSQYLGRREVNHDTFEVKSEWFVVGCYSQATLLFSLVEDIVKTACCQALDKNACLVSSLDILQIVIGANQISIEAQPPSVDDSYLIILTVPGVGGWYDHDNEIATWDGSQWIYTLPTDNLIVNNLDAADQHLYFYTVTNGWHIVSEIECANILAHSFEAKGYILLGTTGYLYYRKTGDPIWIFVGKYTPEDLDDGILIAGLIDDTDYDVRVLALNNNCDYGFGEITICHTLAEG